MSELSLVDSRWVEARKSTHPLSSAAYYYSRSSSSSLGDVAHGNQQVTGTESWRGHCPGSRHWPIGSRQGTIALCPMKIGNSFKHEKCSVTMLLSYPASMCLLFIPYWMALLEELLPSPFFQLLLSGKASLCKGGDCDVRRSSEWLWPTFGSRGCESPEGNRVDLVKVQGGDLSGLWPLKLITIPK